MTPPLPNEDRTTGLSVIEPMAVDRVLTSGGGSSVGEYETHPLGIRLKGSQKTGLQREVSFFEAKVR